MHTLLFSDEEIILFFLPEGKSGTERLPVFFLFSQTLEKDRKTRKNLTSDGSGKVDMWKRNRI